MMLSARLSQATLHFFGCLASSDSHVRREGLLANHTLLKRPLARPRVQARQWLTERKQRFEEALGGRHLALPPGRGGAAQARRLQRALAYLAFERGNYQRLEHATYTSRVVSRHPCPSCTIALVHSMTGPGAVGLLYGPQSAHCRLRDTHHCGGRDKTQTASKVIREVMSG